MRLPKPKVLHPPEVYAAVVAEHRGKPMMMAQRLEQLGWRLAEAAWAATNWDVTLLAAAIVHRREKWEQPPPDSTPPSSGAPPESDALHLKTDETSSKEEAY